MAPQQQEMPLAVVHGQPLLQIPQDLYIPPDALEVILDAFEGPLDLLLYLIRRQNLDILDIPVAEITRQYVDYIQAMHEMRFELAAEYLVMAAILAEIKSRMLLPRPPSEVTGKETNRCSAGIPSSRRGPGRTRRAGPAPSICSQPPASSRPAGDSRRCIAISSAGDSSTLSSCGGSRRGSRKNIRAHPRTSVRIVSQAITAHRARWSPR